MRIQIPLDGLGMDEKAMLELVNRMNENDNRKWIFMRGVGTYQQAANVLASQAMYCSQMAIQ